MQSWRNIVKSFYGSTVPFLKCVQYMCVNFPMTPVERQL